MSTTTEFENNENNHLLLLVNNRVTTFCSSIRRNSKCIEKPLSLGKKYGNRFLAPNNSNIDIGRKKFIFVET